jgi:hypothetical protein
VVAEDLFVESGDSGAAERAQVVADFNDFLAGHPELLLDPVEDFQIVGANAPATAAGEQEPFGLDVMLPLHGKPSTTPIHASREWSKVIVTIDATDG